MLCSAPRAARRIRLGNDEQATVPAAGGRPTLRRSSAAGHHWAGTTDIRLLATVSEDTRSLSPLSSILSLQVRGARPRPAWHGLRLPSPLQRRGRLPSLQHGGAGGQAGGVAVQDEPLHQGPLPPHHRQGPHQSVSKVGCL